MNIDTITQIISSFGFPVFCCVYLLWHDDKLNNQHKEEINKLTETINNNTLALTKLSDRLDNLEDRLNRGDEK